MSNWMNQKHLKGKSVLLMPLPVKEMVPELELKPEVKLVRFRKRPDPNPYRLLVAQRNLEAVLQVREDLLSEDPSRLPSKNKQEVYFRRKITISNEPVLIVIH